MLAPALRRDACLRPLDDLEQGLLDALSGDVSRDGEVLRLTGNLVYLVYVDDADLRAGDVEIRGGDELEQDILHVFAHVSRLGERSRIGDGEGDAQGAGERLREERLAASGGAEQQDVALGQLHVVVGGLGAQADALVVVVDRYRQGAFGILLPDDEGAQTIVELVGRGQVVEDLRRIGDVVGIPFVVGLRGGIAVGRRRPPPQIAHHRIRAHRDALVAYADAVRAGDHSIHLGRGLAAECAANLVVPAIVMTIGGFSHGCLALSLLLVSDKAARARDPAAVLRPATRSPRPCDC